MLVRIERADEKLFVSKYPSQRTASTHRTFETMLFDEDKRTYIMVLLVLKEVGFIPAVAGSFYSFYAMTTDGIVALFEYYVPRARTVNFSLSKMEIR